MPSVSLDTAKRNLIELHRYVIGLKFVLDESKTTITLVRPKIIVTALWRSYYNVSVKNVIPVLNASLKAVMGECDSIAKCISGEHPHKGCSESSVDHERQSAFVSLVEMLYKAGLRLFIIYEVYKVQIDRSISTDIRIAYDNVRYMISALRTKFSTMLNNIENLPSLI